MNPEDNPYDGDPIPLESESQSEPSISKSSSDDLFAPDTASEPVDPSASRFRKAESASALGAGSETQFKRPVTKTGRGATRVRTFHTKLADAAIKFLESQINEWLDGNPDIEVKFSNTTVGVVEGKRAEPHLIITVWY